MPMMHLFYVHSTICFKICMAIIKYYQLDNNKCVFISVRGFRPKSNHVVLRIEDFDLKSYQLCWNFFKLWHIRNKFDRTVDALVNKSPFHAYIPQSTIPLAELIITHRLCNGFSYIEEGHGSYSPAAFFEHLYPRGKSILFRIKRLLSANRIGSHPFFELNKCENVFCTSATAFPEADAKKKVVLDIFPEKRMMKPNPCQDILYCIFDAISIHYDKFRSCHIQSFATGIHQMLNNHLFKGIKIKFHPAQSASPELPMFYDTIVSEFGKIIKIEALDPRFDFEEFMITAPPLKIILLCSSIGLYALRLGHEVFSIFSIFRRALPQEFNSDAQVDYMKRVSSQFVHL